MEFKSISYNFNVAKVISILIIATGHFSTNSQGILASLWIVVSIALFVFSFSSGFFTANKYSGNFHPKNFWKAKILRLIPSIIVIDIFLLIAFIIQGKENILSWHTIPSLFGLNGILNWIGIANLSPFGGGLWFFTVLLLFYFLYPLLNILLSERKKAVAFLILSYIILSLMHYNITIGYMIWLTVFGFIFGVFMSTYRITIKARYCALIFILSTISMVLINKVFAYNSLNYFFICICSISLCLYLLNKKLPDFILNKTTLLSTVTLEIYFIHTTLFITPTNIEMIDYLLSFMLIILTSLCLNKITGLIIKFALTSQRVNNQMALDQ